jgi:hypothetical protein
MISCENKGLLRPGKGASAPHLRRPNRILNTAMRLHGLELNQELASVKVPCI